MTLTIKGSLAALAFAAFITPAEAQQLAGPDFTTFRADPSALSKNPAPKIVSTGGASQSKPRHRTGREFDVHIGSLSAGNLTTTLTSVLPPAGPTFTDFRGGQSRVVPSWFFGDGAALANAVTAQTGDGVSIIPIEP